MKRPKYHFLTVIGTANGNRLVTLPGQTFGLRPVGAFTIVKDAGKGAVVKNAKRKMTPGEVYFTTTLAEAAHCYTARDIYPLDRHANVLYQDAMEEFEKTFRNTED